MALEGDEDTVMGEACNPGAPAQFDGPSQPSITSPLLGQTFKLPLSRHPLNSQPLSASSKPEHEGGISPPKSLPKSVDSGDVIGDDEKNDSLVEENSDWSDGDAVARTGLPLASLPSGLCYDVQMRYHCEVRPTADVHPEDPRRIYYIYKELCRAGLVDDPESSRPLVSRPLKRINARNATEEEISLVHTPDHYAFVESTQDMTDDELIALEHTRDSIYFNKLTFASSILSVGGAIETCLAVATRKVKNAIAVIRPPGHHAEHDKTMGFCLFNNVSVAARVCQQQLGESCRKILILDWDVHHGNGIQKAFYDDPNILYISLHVYQEGKFYPGGDEGDWDHCGGGAGVGRNVNIPWPSQGMGDGDYMYAFQQVVMPIAQEFNPDLVIIASGFDAAAGDELGGCFVTPACYAHMTHMLMTLANGKVAVCLEGGYNFRSISKSALAVTKTLMGDPPDRLHSTTPSEAATTTVRRVMMIQSAYWSCMYPKAPQQEGHFTDRLHDVIRAYQSKQLYDNYKLTSLYIYRTAISKSFENQVLASPNYHQAKPLLVFFHDPPEIMSLPHPVTNKLEAHNCWLADVLLKDYVGWAVEKGYAVIDVNIPKHVTIDPSSGKYEDEDENRPTATEELAGYLWDNYIEPNEATEIFFIGIGNAFYGVANLLINRETLYKRVNGVVSFVAENPVRAVASHTQVWLSRWYKDNSLVFVSHTHGVWTSLQRKPSKRYGLLVQSPKAGLSEMLMHHKNEVYQWISERADVADSEEIEDEKPKRRSPTKGAATGEDQRGPGTS
ncbi:histone deacetylase hdaA [Aspergillus brunneoviolaceus CBS 621.78]|uniref:Histone deacetylase Hda1 n=1 Tax=Aspergillus brunneoviolaceus CBS 621.78 TaxID=1450534 RepID=A0ACD1GJD6_9EURO|nr:histone deacetylase Hda1 [Aspergillus brunneoviolaceus CBS 621.78]RAH49355.1 histone deacetylase Hda1 [Aspergillus brunneoviolaceus CBS 621.78]